MKFLKIFSFIFGFIIFCLGLYFLKNLFFAGVILVGAGLFLTAIPPVIPEPKVKKFKLSKDDIDKIISDSEKDSIEQEVKFLDIAKDREIIDTVSEWDFEESLIALHTIEKVHPNLITGKGVNL